MKGLSDSIVKRKKFILIFYAMLILFSIILSFFININYDLSSYLPDELNSIEGKKLLDSEFGIKGTAYILVKNKTLDEIKGYVSSMEKIKDIKKVTWLGSNEDILKPTEFMEESVTKEFISQDSNLIQVFFREQDDTENTISAMDEIKELVGHEAYIGGPAAVSYDIRNIIDKEIIYYSIVAFIIISIILFLSMESFIEPILFFVTIGVAIILNMGTNALFSNVSYMTHSIAAILQLAVSMDYSIFLLHRFMEEKSNYPSKNKAMSKAIRETFVSILSSSMTTVGGFLALVWMKYGIGKDMGLVLAKGVIFSLITVITLLPVLILLFDKQIEKYKHKVYFPNFKRIAPFIIKRRYIWLIIAIVITVPAFLAQGNVEYYYSNEKILPKSANSIVANKEIDNIFQTKNQLALIIPKEEKIKEVALMKELEYLDGVKDIRGLYSLVDITIPESFLPDEIKSNFSTDNYSMINLILNRPMEGENTKKTLDNIRKVVSSQYEEYYLTGEASIYADLENTTSKDFSKVTIISISIISGIIMLAFKSIAIPLILVFIIELGIWINLSIPYLLENQLNFISFIIIGAIQLGATVDYAILYTSRFKENLINMNKKEAAIESIKDTGPSILTSALILFTGTLSVSLITSIKNASELTMLIGRGALISLVLVLGLLPSILIIFNRFISLTTLNWPKSENKRRF